VPWAFTLGCAAILLPFPGLNILNLLSCAPSDIKASHLCYWSLHSICRCDPDPASLPGELLLSLRDSALSHFVNKLSRCCSSRNMQNLSLGTASCLAANVTRLPSCCSYSSIETLLTQAVVDIPFRALRWSFCFEPP
jgi:hypothetical protein